VRTSISGAALAVARGAQALDSHLHHALGDELDHLAHPTTGKQKSS
jgi:hypothetical protein